MYTVVSTFGTHRVLNPERGVIALGTSEADARRIARALNLEAAMGEVREALVDMKRQCDDENKQALCPDKRDRLGRWMPRITQALAALDRAGEV